MLKVIKIFTAIVFIFFSNQTLAGAKNYDALIQDQSTKIKDLEGRVAALEGTVQSLIQSQNKIPSTAEKPLVSGSEQTKVQTSEESVNMPTSANSEKTEYDLALASLKDGNFEEAERKFHDFNQQFPQSKLRENALFWYGESFFRRDDFNQAAINYSKAYKEYPKGAKASDALLKLSLSLGALDKTKEACSILDKLDTEFPNRPANSKNRSKAAQTKFNCKK